MRRLLLISLLSLISLPALRAQAIITWGSSQAIAGDTDVSTTGTAKWAYSFGGSNDGSFTLNTVSFSKVDASSVSSTVTFSQTEGNLTQYANTFGGSTTPYTSLSGNYQYLLSTAAYWENDYSSSNKITLQGLTPGNTYQIQIWSDDSRGSDRTSIYNDGQGHSVTLDMNRSDADGGLGSFVLGTFVASGSTEIINAVKGSPSGVNQFNAIQLRDITGVSAVPEPSTYAAIGGIAALGFAMWNRRRQKQA